MSDCRFGVSPVNYPDPDPGVGVGDIERDWLLLLIILYDREVLRRQIE